MKHNLEKLSESDYTIEFVPNLLERLIGKKRETKKYKTKGSTFHYFPNQTVFYSEDGETVGPLSNISKILNNFKRKKELFG
jgi:hypothetical protein